MQALSQTDRRLDLYRQGMNDMQIANILGVGSTAIYKWRKKNGLKANHIREVKDNRVELYRKKMSDGQIAKELGIKREAVADWRKHHGLPANNFERKPYVNGGSICWSCTRARALPDPMGCAFHRRGHIQIFDKAVIADRRNNGTEYKSITVTECQHYEREKWRRGGDEE